MLPHGKGKAHIRHPAEYAYQRYQVLLREVRKGKRQYYGGIARAKEYKALPEVLSREEMKSIFAQLSNRKHRCMISLIYSAGLRRSELLNLTPQDIISERMLIRIAGKGKKCRYSLLSEKLLNELRLTTGNTDRKNGFLRANRQANNTRPAHWLRY